MATTKTILAALKLVDAKKENLRKAFEDLQSHSFPLSSFNLTWSDLDSYFTSLQSSLDRKFEVLQSLDEPPPLQLQQSQSLLSNHKSPQSQTPNLPQPQTHIPPKSQPLIAEGGLDSALNQSELKSFCEKMDGLGLRKYMVEGPKGRNTIRSELPNALRCAPDAAAMVLDAMKGFYVPNSFKGERNFGLSAIRRNSILLLENLMIVKAEIGAETREKARNLASEWKGNISSGDREENLQEVLAFLHLIVVYGVEDAFDVRELIDLAVEVARFPVAVDLLSMLSLEDKRSDVIVQLLRKGKLLLAATLIFQFDLCDKFPPVPVLEKYVNDRKHLTKKALNDKNRSFRSQNKALTKEARAYRSVIKLMEDYNFEHDSLKEKLIKGIEIVNKIKSNRNSNAVVPAFNTQLRSGRKRPRNTVPAFQEGLVSKYLSPYLGSAAGPYGLAVAPDAGSYEPREYHWESNRYGGYYPE